MLGFFAGIGVLASLVVVWLALGIIPAVIVFVSSYGNILAALGTFLCGPLSLYRLVKMFADGTIRIDTGVK